MSFETAYFEAAAGLSGQLPASVLPEVVFSGKSNVGKSSMINRLLGRKSIARVSAKPGKTITVNFYNLGFCRFVDLPGYGYARVARSEKQRWAGLVEGYFTSDRDIRLLVQLVDIRRDPSEDDWQMIRFAEQNGIPCLVVATKADKLKQTERKKRIAALENEFSPGWGILLPFSALSSDGTEFVRKEILKYCK